ncbi:MAG: metal-dependent hydrolase [Candidatus Methanodesulfokora sp.]|mgnify:CR=1 FL=1|jgi:inner membrane protein
MSKKTHLAFALFLSSYLLRSNPQLLIFVPIVFVSAMLPDLDLALRSIPFIEHRKTFHNIWFMIAVMIIFWSLTHDALLTRLFSIGIVSHFLMDSLTKQGVMWLYPLSNWRIRGPLRTGGLVDSLIGAASILASAYLMTGYLSQPLS